MWGVVAVTGGRRRQIRDIIRYLKALRELVSRAAGEHARWVKFLAESASLLRASPSPFRVADAEGARKYAAAFGKYRAFLTALTPPAYCLPVHTAALKWLENLDLLSSAVGPAIDAKNPGNLDAIVRSAGEAQIRLRTFQRVHGRTIEGMTKLFRERGKPAAKAPAKPARRVGVASPIR